MIEITPETRVFVSLSPIDFRAGINRLGAIAAEVFARDPMREGIFLFHNRRKTDIKLITYDCNGFFMGHKRLSKGKLSWWPRTEGESLSITVAQLNRLLKGVDPRGSFNPEWEALKHDKSPGTGESERRRMRRPEEQT